MSEAASVAESHFQTFQQGADLHNKQEVVLLWAQTWSLRESDFLKKLIKAGEHAETQWLVFS